MTQQTRARKGGEQGMNGEFYNGGTFLPNTMLRKGTTVKAEAAPRKREVAPYTWEIAPTATAWNIWSLAGVTLDYDRKAQRLNVTSNAGAIAHYGNVRAGYTLAELADMWNNGARWVEPK